MKQPPHFIAETDENGSIACVWRARPKGRPPKPIKNPAKHLDSLDKASFSGASATDIATWLAQQAAK